MTHNAMLVRPMMPWVSRWLWVGNWWVGSWEMAAKKMVQRSECREP